MTNIITNQIIDPIKVDLKPNHAEYRKYTSTQSLSIYLSFPHYSNKSVITGSVLPSRSPAANRFLQTRKSLGNDPIRSGRTAVSHQFFRRARSSSTIRSLHQRFFFNIQYSLTAKHTKVMKRKKNLHTDVACASFTVMTPVLREKENLASFNDLSTLPATKTARHLRREP